MLDKKTIKKLNHLRSEVDKEKKRLRIFSPRFTIQMDSRTKRITLSYSVPVDKGLDKNNNRITSKIQKKKYLKGIYVDDVELIKNNLQTYADEILREKSSEYKTIGSNRDNLEHWKRVYTETSTRRGNIKVSEKTLNYDKQSIETLIKWLKVHKPDHLNIWNWVSSGRDTFLEFLKYKQEVGGDKKKWSDGSCQTSYRRVRSFFNFISEKIEGFPKQLLNKLPVAQPKVKIETFSSMDIRMILEFLEEHKSEPTWEWFVPIFKVLLETGMRVSEVVQMKIRDIDINEQKISILGKGNKRRNIYFRSKGVWDIICSQIYNENGKIRTDTEWVFWYKHKNTSYGKSYLVEKKDKRFRSDGVIKKTKTMIRLLNLDDSLSTHDTRRYFITEMLKKTGGNIPLVAQLVGHSSWDLVKRYTKNVVDANTEVNIGMFD